MYPYVHIPFFSFLSLHFFLIFSYIISSINLNLKGKMLTIISLFNKISLIKYVFTKNSDDLLFNENTCPRKFQL